MNARNLAVFALALAGCQSLEFPGDPASSGLGDDGPGMGSGGAFGTGPNGSDSASTGSGGVPDVAATQTTLPVGGFMPSLPDCNTNPDPTFVEQAPARVHRSFASAQFTKTSVQAGNMPPPESIRVEDFAAYWGAHAPAPTPAVGASFVIDPKDATQGDLEVRAFMGDAPKASVGGRAPVNFIVLADVSSSMSSVKTVEAAAIDSLAITLKASGDSMVLFTYAGDVRRFDGDALDATADPELLATRAGDDLHLALEEAKAAVDDTVQNQIIVLTDGGTLADAPLATLLGAIQADGVRSSVVQLGKPKRDGSPLVLHDELLRSFASNGGGSALFVADVAEVQSALGARLQENFFTAIPDGVLALGLPGGFQSLEDATLTDAQVTGATLVYGRSHAFKHRMAMCAAAKEVAIGNGNMTIPLDAYLLDGSRSLDLAPIHSTLQFDLAFFAPSAASVLEAAAVDAAAFFRTGSVERFDAARCGLATVAQAKGAGACDDPMSVCGTANDLAGVLDEAAQLSPGVTSDCIGL